LVAIEFAMFTYGTTKKPRAERPRAERPSRKRPSSASAGAIGAVNFMAWLVPGWRGNVLAAD
jgi:hypothetical protein